MLNEAGVVFCNPPISLRKMYGALTSGGAFIPPLNLLSLAAQTRLYGYDTKIIDCSVEKLDFGQSADKITSFKSRYIGITATTISINDAAKLAQKIKARSPFSYIIIGGVHLTALPLKTMLDHPEFDVGVYGEGEITIVNLLNVLKNKEDISSVKGVVFRDKAGRVHITEKQPLIEDLDILPAPAWDLLDGFATKYAPTTSRMTGLPSIYLNSSRGCPYRCIFCDRSVLGHRFRGFSDKRIVQLFRKAKEEFQVKHITIYDENMAINKERVVDFCKSLIEANLSIHWSCDMRADFIAGHEDIPALMYDSGCRSVSFGIESGSQEVLDFYQKGESLEDIKKAVSLMSRAGINTTGFFILGGPTESIATIQATISFASSLELDYALPFYFTPFPGSSVYNQIGRYGVFKENWDLMSTAAPLFLPHGITEKKLEQLYSHFIVKFYCNHKRLFRLFRKNLNARSLWRLFKTGLGILPVIAEKIIPHRNYAQYWKVQ
ncbi:MAG: radical SAM protein [Candidatus Omnitrophica bacterium]|nr:radical SAM protein [Candidatus Omnitrophota bacterium]